MWITLPAVQQGQSTAPRLAGGVPRYDALGRRVLVRTRRDGLCNTSQSTVDCTSGIERYVWAGDNIVWEMRGPGGNTETAERLEQDYTTGVEYGIVGYTHAGGVDRPLVAYKTAGGNSGAVVVPHMNWRGLFSMGTNSAGGTSTTPVEWTGFRTTAYHSQGETQESTKNWMGSLLEGQRDAGGQMYMRNRYYDPKTGQFTQTDPIGIAGGLNTYGFANGDPVTYSDPYGLRPEDVIVACRTVDDTRGLGGHCAVRVVNEKLNIDVTYELLSNGIGEPQFAGQTPLEQAARYEGRGVQVAVPNGMTSDEFDLRVLANAERISQERNGQLYSPSGTRNSNRFVYDVITQSGGKVPWRRFLTTKQRPESVAGGGSCLVTTAAVPAPREAPGLESNDHETLPMDVEHSGGSRVRNGARHMSSHLASVRNE